MLATYEEMSRAASAAAARAGELATSAEVSIATIEGLADEIDKAIETLTSRHKAMIQSMTADSDAVIDAIGEVKRGLMEIVARLKGTSDQAAAPAPGPAGIDNASFLGLGR